MKRREFMGCVGAAAGVSFGVDKAIAQPVLDHELVETAVKANFGSSFRLLTAHRAPDGVVAIIEHLENRLQVSSSDLNNWKVLRSSEM